MICQIFRFFPAKFNVENMKWVFFFCFCGVELRDSVKKIREYLIQEGIDAPDIFLDYYSIPIGTDFWDACRYGIENSLFFVPFISWSFVNATSDKVDPRQEIIYAKNSGRPKKSIIPIFYEIENHWSIEKRIKNDTLYLTEELNQILVEYGKNKNMIHRNFKLPRKDLSKLIVEKYKNRSDSIKNTNFGKSWKNEYLKVNFWSKWGYSKWKPRFITYIHTESGKEYQEKMSKKICDTLGWNSGQNLYYDGEEHEHLYIIIITNDLTDEKIKNINENCPIFPIIINKDSKYEKIKNIRQLRGIVKNQLKENLIEEAFNLIFSSVIQFKDNN